MFQSAEFSHGMIGPKRVRDTIRVEIALKELQATLQEASPVRMFLCTEGQILASLDAAVPLLTPGISMSMSMSKSNIDV